MAIMVICDICGAKATCKVIFSNDDQRYDLCETHKSLMIELINSPEPQDKKKPGRPRKTEDE
jgi:hypothetical protein